MPPVIHAFDWESLLTRLGSSAVILSVIVTAGGGWALLHYDVPREESIVYMAVLAPFWFAPMAFLFVKPRPSTRDQLRLDEQGLTRTRGSRTRRWSWAEVSDFRLHGYLHPASLVLGRSISFRVPDDDRRFALPALVNRILFFGHNAAIGDNYLSDIRDLAAGLNHWRNMALGQVSRAANARRSRTPFSPTGPAVFFNREKLRDSGKLRRALGLALLSLVGTLGALAIVSAVDIEDLPAKFEDLAQSPMLLAGLPVAAVGVFFTVFEAMGRDAASQNLVVLSSGGLQLRRNGERQHWLWHEVAEPELRRMPGTAMPGGSAQAISFVATHNGKRPGKSPDGGPLPAAAVHSLEDVYDAPLDEIVGQMRAWREASVALRHASGETVDLPAAQVPGEAADDAISFRRRWAPAPSALMTTGIWLLQVPMLGGLAAAFWVANAELSRGMTLGLAAAVMLVAIASPLLTVYLAAGGGANNLRLDRDGLTYVRLGRIAGWPWRELSSFDLRPGTMRWSRKEVPLITFALPRDDRLSRFLRWAYGIRGAQALAVIEDVYETPLGEIARQLSQYRERASVQGQRTAPS